jgi:enoyl-CoA hydratase/carnithine racemase
MKQKIEAADVHVEVDGHVALVEMRRPPHNFLDFGMIAGLVDAFERLDADPRCRAIVLAADGRSFCAGGDFAGGGAGAPGAGMSVAGVYAHAVRLFRTGKPVVAAVQGPAIGGGLGLALVADFRITCPEARFSANFNRLGFHPGFGLSVTLPRLVGPQRAALLLYTGRRIDGDEAAAIGLAEESVPAGGVRERAIALAEEIAISAPIAVASTRRTLRGRLADEVQAATEHEAAEQQLHFATEDFREGVAAMAQRRAPDFKGR